MSNIDKLVETVVIQLSNDPGVIAAFENWFRDYFERMQFENVEDALVQSKCVETGRRMYITPSTEFAFNAFLAGSIITCIDLKV